MTLHAPHNPLESDDEFYEIIEHSRQSDAPVAQVPVNSDLQRLEQQWRSGKLSHRDYVAQKFAVERAARVERGKNTNHP